jgi:hypothetical protein
MKKLLIPFMVVAMVLSGCSLLDKEPTPKDLVSEAFKNLEGMDYYDYELEFGGEVIAEGETVDFDISYNGKQDNTDKTKPKFTMAIDVGVSVEEFENQSVKGEIRSDGEFLYFILSEVSDFNGELPAEMVDPFVGQWYSLSLTDDLLGSVSPFSTMSMYDEENMTDEQKELMELYEDTEFLKDVEFVKTEDGYDVYTGALDKEASKKFVNKAMEMQGQSLTGDEEEEFYKFMESVDVDMLMYVDIAENALTKVTGTVTMTGMEGVDADLEFSMAFMNLHEPVVIEVPTDVEEFDPMMVLGAMMGMDPAMMEAAMTDDFQIDDGSDPFMMDSSGYEDSGMEDYAMDDYDLDEFNKEMEKAVKEMEEGMAELGY